MGESRKVSVRQWSCEGCVRVTSLVSCGFDFVVVFPVSFKLFMYLLRFHSKSHSFVAPYILCILFHTGFDDQQGDSPDDTGDFGES